MAMKLFLRNSLSVPVYLTGCCCC